MPLVLQHLVSTWDGGGLYNAMEPNESPYVYICKLRAVSSRAENGVLRQNSGFVPDAYEIGSAARSATEYGRTAFFLNPITPLGEDVINGEKRSQL